MDKNNPSSEFVFSGLKAKVTPRGSVGGSNKAGNVKVLESEAFSDQKIREYAQQLAGDVPLKNVSQGVYRADLSDGTIVHLRSVSSSSNETKARWTIEIRDNPPLREFTKEKKLKLNSGDR
ncbi:DUF769 domain-containing protein [Xylella fastidiosa]|uniref:DUF769 domain-containing protein n=1 Tax=Xylella fastidiosa TaxID=2371 RepID=UPI001F421E96|nr:DUF769 domain-containing protein [Xylella fastidiosa]